MKQTRSFTRRSALLAGTAALALVGASSAQAQEALRFGMAMPLSGGQATYGQDQVKAAEWAVAEINQKGGVNGKKLEMIVLDTRADPQAGIQAANRLISVEKVPAFVSAWSAVVKAIAPVANDNKVVQLSVGANSADIAKLGDYTYTTFPLADVDITAVARYAATQMGKKKAAVIYINNETGTVAAQIYRDVFTKAGGQVVAYEAYDPKASDWTGPLLKVRAAQPDMIHIQGLVADTPQVIAQMRQLGLTQPVSSYSAVYNPKLIEQLGKAAEGVIATSLAPGVTDSPAVAAYVERWKKEVGREPNGLPYTQYLYDAPYIVAAVYKSMDDKKLPMTGENFRKEMLAMRSFDLPLTGKLTINDDHTVNKPVYLMEVKDGKWTQKAVVN
ncbi:ABC transporter substrate-binding protein [Enterovirga aerilata]|uniref:ABC transporter substrate-binding protein n=1 Tax=Enterovirga aerilata TaxID=2730920 RepID=A0A849IF97_9HYPH|nr:ABC transporter substrate-binding protein [Enterovirga sp. DB1703]NNM75119.1 ABC transporter substrate-binding protein [Enterovirga sp. DB1703]